MNEQTSCSPLHANRRGFTLVEVLVSSALTIIVLGMLFTVLLGVMNAWEGGTSRLQTNADARLALDLIARDLQSMVVRQTPYNQEWLVAYPVTVANAPGGATSTWLTFFSPSLDRDSGQEGDIVAISYRVGYQDPLSVNSDFVPIFGLYKSMIDTTNTFAHALGKTDILTGFWNSALTINGTPVSSLPLAKPGFIIPNVVDFKISWWVRDIQTNNLVPVPATSAIRLGNTLRVNNTVVNARIEAADISLTILTDEGMRLARLAPARMSDHIREHGRTHTQRVVIRY